MAILVTPKPKKSEATFRDEVCAYLRSKKVWHFVYPANTTYGLPDIMALHKGHFIGIELKRPDGKGRPTQLQIETKRSIEAAGGFALITDNLEDIKHVIKVIETEHWPE